LSNSDTWHKVKEARVRERILPLLLCAGLMTLAGCATTETVLLDLKGPGPSADVKAGKTESLRVAVLPFEDTRPDKSRLGIRTHYWTGSVTYFRVSGGQPVDKLTQFVADYLTLKGWQAEVARRGGAGSSGADVILSAKVLLGDGDAASWLFRTNLVVKAKFDVEALNVADGSIVRMTLSGDGSDGFFWFGPDEMEDLIRDVLVQMLDQFLATTKVDNKRLVLK